MSKLAVTTNNSPNHAIDDATKHSKIFANFINLPAYNNNNKRDSSQIADFRYLEGTRTFHVRPCVSGVASTQDSDYKQEKITLEEIVI